MGRFLAIGALLAACLGGSAVTAGAATPEPQVSGPYCTPIGCAGASGSPWSSATGFAAAALASGVIARRRPADSR
jgi:hypothetical protein